MRQHEALIVLRGQDGWQLTGCFRVGPESVITNAGWVGQPGWSRIAQMPVSSPCLLITTPHICRIDTPEHCLGLAQWLTACAVAMQLAQDEISEEEGQ
jgi:hypothetical protein